MTFVVGATAHGSPGVSTALQLVAASWPGAAHVPVVVESDATGGVLAARYELSLNPGFVTLAESLRQFESPSLLDHAQRLPSGVACVPISPSATAASAQLRSAGPYLGPYLRQAGHPVLLDTGTLLPDGKAVPTLTAADLLLWFVRPTREELLVLRHRLAECPQPDQVAIVLVGETPYNAEQVTEALGVQVLHRLPVDRRGAAAANLGGDDRYLRRSQLARSCSQLAQLIADRIDHVSSTVQVEAASTAKLAVSSASEASAEVRPPPAAPPSEASAEMSPPPPSAGSGSGVSAEVPPPPRPVTSVADVSAEVPPPPPAAAASDISVEVPEEITTWVASDELPPSPGSAGAEAEAADVEDQDEMQDTVSVWVPDGD